MFIMVLSFEEAVRFTTINGWVQNALALGSKEIIGFISASNRGVNFLKPEG